MAFQEVGGELVKKGVSNWEKPQHLLYRTLSLDLLPLHAGENRRKHVMLLWWQGEIWNWIFFCRSLLCKALAISSVTKQSNSSQTRKIITAKLELYESQTPALVILAKKKKKKCLFPRMKISSLKTQFFKWTLHYILKSETTKRLREISDAIRVHNI